MKVSLVDRLLAVLYALDGQTYVASDGVRLEVVNARPVRRVLQAIFLAGVLAAVGMWFVTPLLALAAVPATGALVFATILLLPSIRKSKNEPNGIPPSPSREGEGQG